MSAGGGGDGGQDDERDDGERALEMARAIRPYLEGLLGDADEARALDAELAGLLDPPEPRAIVERLLAVPALRDWAGMFAATGYPPDLVRPELRWVELPGTGGPVRPARLACPRGDFVVYRRFVGQVIPLCPTHGLAPE